MTRRRRPTRAPAIARSDRRRRRRHRDSARHPSRPTPRSARCRSATARWPHSPSPRPAPRRTARPRATGASRTRATRPPADAVASRCSVHRPVNSRADAPEGALSGSRTSVPPLHADETFEQRHVRGAQAIRAADNRHRDGVQRPGIEPASRGARGKRGRQAGPVLDAKARVVFERAPDKRAGPRRPRVEHQDARSGSTRRSRRRQPRCRCADASPSNGTAATCSTRAPSPSGHQGTSTTASPSLLPLVNDGADRGGAIGDPHLGPPSLPRPCPDMATRTTAAPAPCCARGATTDSTATLGPAGTLRANQRHRCAPIRRQVDVDRAIGHDRRTLRRARRASGDRAQP